MSNKLPEIPWNVPITSDINPDLYRHPDYMREARNFFMLLLEEGDLKDLKYHNIFGKEVTQDIINNIKLRKQSNIELQNKQWDVDTIRNHEDTRFPTNHHIRKDIHKEDWKFFNLRDSWAEFKFERQIQFVDRGELTIPYRDFVEYFFTKWDPYWKTTDLIVNEDDVSDDSELANKFYEFVRDSQKLKWVDAYLSQCEKNNKPVSVEGWDEYIETKVFKGLRDYQVLDTYYLSKSHSQLITHQMRLGKTGIVSLSIDNSPIMNKGVIVAPKSTLYDWEHTINYWTYGNTKAKVWSSELKPKEREKVLNEWKNGEFGFLVVNYDFFVRYIEDIKSAGKVDLMVIDEAHFLASRTESATMPLTSQRSKKLLEYRITNATHTWLVTGTPTLKKEYEILSLYYFLYPNNRSEERTYKTGEHRPIRNFYYNGEYLSNFKFFFDRFLEITKTPSRENGFTFETKNRHNYDALMKELSLLHRIHRTTSMEVPNMGENIHTDVMIPLTSKQLKTYETIEAMVQTLFMKTDNPLVRDTFLRKLANDQRLLKVNFMNSVDMLIGHSKLSNEYIDGIEDVELRELRLDQRQSAITFLLTMFGESYKGMTDEEVRDEIEAKLDKKYGFDKHGAKTEWLLKWLQDHKREINGGSTKSPVVIFSQFTSYLYMLKDDIEKLGFSVEFLTGRQNGTQRKDTTKRFQEGKIDIILANIASNKEGVTLHRSNQAIFLDRVFSNKDMMQVTERINNPDSIDIKSTLFLMSEDTIDDKVKQFNIMYDKNTRYVNEAILSDISGSKKNEAKALFEQFLAQSL